MYTIKPSNMVVSQKPIPSRKFYASSGASNNNMIHFSYRLVDLQKEIEKRTFYLGKNRSAEGVSHLLDLIGMSRDEGDLLYPFARAAMADVYDQLNSSTLHISKDYEWKDPAQPITLVPIPTANAFSGMNISVVPSSNNSKLIISGTLTDAGFSSGITSIDGSRYDVSLSASITFGTQYTILDGGTTIKQQRRISVIIPAKYIKNTSANNWTIIPFTIDVPLELQSSITSTESIDPTAPISNNVVLNKVTYKDPTLLKVGDIINMSGVVYEILQDTNENDLDLNTQANQVDPNETLVEGIHYYFSVPNFLNITSVEPLDNAIMEALVNRIIWKWLVLSYPSEAATYDTLYQDNLKSIALRCNIFNKHWQQVPRIL